MVVKENQMDEFNASDTFDDNAFREGEVARTKGNSLQSCHYNRGTFLHKSWCAGWADADMVIISETVLHDGYEYPIPMGWNPNTQSQD